MDWTRPCGCRGGDGGCSYGGGWYDKCKDYPNCVSGIEDAKRDVASREYNLPENKAKREKERRLKYAKTLRETADKIEKEYG